MRNTSDVTVIIPCYNDGAYIQEALNSIYSQTTLPAKIIIIDDGSDSVTKNILKKIDNSLVEIIYQPNMGVSNARNTGISRASTKYILNLDADDYLEPTFIEKAVKILTENKEVVAVNCHTREFKQKQTLRIIQPKGGGIRDFIVINNATANSVFYRQCWLAVGGYDEKMLEGYEDWEFWIAVLKNGGKVFIIEETLANYRKKQKSRDQSAVENHDFHLRQYIYLKHREIFNAHADYYISELLRQNSLLRNAILKEKAKNKNSLQKLLFSPLVAIKRQLF